MTITTLDPRARVRHLLDQVTVTSIETGRHLEGPAKRSRILAAARGYEATLVTINWGNTSPEAVREALDALKDPAERAQDAIKTSARESRTVHLDGGSDEGNALYSQCEGSEDTHDGATTEYWGTTASCHTWRVHLHRGVSQ